MLERRQSPSRIFALLSPLLAVALTVLTGLALIALIGKDPIRALEVYFVEPAMDPYLRGEIAIKAVPLALMGAGLAIAFRSGSFNIGAPGQFVLGAIFAGGAALFLPVGPWLLPLSMIAGILGGMLWGWIPAALRLASGANEILVSLMLVYVAELLLEWLVRGPWRSESSRGFPQTDLYPSEALIPGLDSATRLHWGVPVAVIVALGLWWMLHFTRQGYRVKVMGEAPRAGRFAGFSDVKMVSFAFLLSGGLAGLAGAIEVAATIEQLQPQIGHELGFAAIIVAFLGRLDPLGSIFAALALAITYIGGEQAQIALGLPRNATLVFQGLLLFFLLACDTLIHYRLRLFPQRARSAESRV